MPTDPTADPATEFAAIGAEQFVALTTFRRSGAPVPTTVWIAPDGDALVVTTPDGTGKVKRVRRDPRVRMQPCARLGAVPDGAPVVDGMAEVLTDPADVARSHRRIRAKYGFAYRVIMVLEKLTRTGRRPRVILRIRPA